MQSQVLSNTSCPANSTYNGTDCTCASGYIAQNGQCVQPPADPCENTQGLTTGHSRVLVQFDNVNVTASALGTFMGQSVTTAVPISGNNCAATGVVEDCGLFPSNSGSGSTLLCYLSGTTYTGSTYNGEQSLFGLPKIDPDATPIEDMMGVCPEGQYSGNVNGQPVCVKPNGSANTTTSTTTNADGTSTTTETTTSCVGDKCTESTTTTTKDAQGNTTGSSTTDVTADKLRFCEENPDSPMCKGGSFSATCESFTCDGDAVMCGMARKQYEDSCKLYSADNDAGSVANKAIAGTDGFNVETMKANAELIDVGDFDSSGSGWPRSCPADYQVNFQGSSFDIPFSKVCPLLSVMAQIAVAITLLGCLTWVARGDS